MSDRTNNRIRELLAQSRALWAICERFDEISFELRALAPLTLQPGETDRLTHQKHRLSAGVTLLQRRRAAILNHILFTLSRHHVLQNAARQHVLTTACRELIHAQRYGLGVDGNAPLSQMIREFDQVRAAQQMSAMRSLVMRLELALIASPGYHPHRTHPLQPEELSPHTAMMCTLMAYDAYPHDYPDVSSTEFCHFIAYHYAHVTLTSARTISVRDLVPEGATSGIAGTAFIFSGQHGEQVFVNFRGAERTGKNGEWLETARDWTYMLSAVLLGRGGEADQLPHARSCNGCKTNSRPVLNSTA